MTFSLRTAVPVPETFEAKIVTLKLPEAVGVPVINPLEEFTSRPFGSPSALKLVGELLATIWYEKNCSTFAIGDFDGIATRGGGGATVSVSVSVPSPKLFLANKLTVNTPALVGLPLMMPVFLFNLSPAGNPFVEKLLGELREEIA